MEAHTEPPSPSASAGASASASAGKKSLVAKAAGAVGRNPHAALAAIVVLTLLVVALYVYYHGLFHLGPFASAAPASSSSAGRGKTGSRKPDSGDTGASSKPDGAPDAGDPETERLIAAINGKK